MPITRISDPVYEYVCDFDGTTVEASELPEGWCVTAGGGAIACPVCAAKTTLAATQEKAAELAAAEPELVGDALPVALPTSEVASRL